MSTLFENLFDRIDVTLDSMATIPLLGFMNNAVAIAAPVLTIWIILRAVNAYRGNDRFENLFYDAVIAAIIIGFATSSSVFNNIFRVNALELGNWIAGISSVGIPNLAGVDSVGKILDAQSNAFFDVINQKWSELSWRDFAGALVLGALFFAFIFLLVIVVYSIGMGKVGSIILIVLAPIFILSLLFKSTQNFFAQWLGFLINFQLMIGLSVLLLAFFTRIGIFDDLQKIDNTDLVGLMMPFVMIGVFIALMRQVPQLATALSGGVAMSVDGLVNRTMNTATKAASATIDGSGEAVKSGGRVLDHLTNNKVSQGISTFGDKINNALEARGIPTHRAMNERRLAFQQVRQNDRQRRIASHMESINNNKPSQKNKTSNKDIQQQGKYNIQQGTVEQSRQTPEQPIGTVEQSQQAPKQKIDTLGQSQQAPKQKIDTLGQSQQAPKQKIDTLGQSRQAPAHQSIEMGQQRQTPDQPRIRLDKNAEQKISTENYQPSINERIEDSATKNTLQKSNTANHSINSKIDNGEFFVATKNHRPSASDSRLEQIANKQYSEINAMKAANVDKPSQNKSQPNSTVHQRDNVVNSTNKQKTQNPRKAAFEKLRKANRKLAVIERTKKVK